MDTTYLGRRFGVVVMKDSRSRKILWRKFIFRKETLSNYCEGGAWLHENGFKIEGYQYKQWISRKIQRPQKYHNGL